MFMVFWTFCVYIRVDILEINTHIVLMFMEFLVENQFKVSSVHNYISAISVYAKWLGLDNSCFAGYRISLMFRALNNSIRNPPKFKGILQVQDLTNILNACKNFSYPLLFQTLYIFAFFGFFRISNLVPTSMSVYNLAKHLSRNDVFVVENGLVVLVKWSNMKCHTS